MIVRLACLVYVIILCLKKSKIEQVLGVMSKLILRIVRESVYVFSDWETEAHLGLQPGEELS